MYSNRMVWSGSKCIYYTTRKGAPIEVYGESRVAIMIKIKVDDVTHGGMHQ